jgi:hypothetical protein
MQQERWRSSKQNFLRWSNSVLGGVQAPAQCSRPTTLDEWHLEAPWHGLRGVLKVQTAAYRGENPQKSQPPESLDGDAQVWVVRYERQHGWRGPGPPCSMLIRSFKRARRIVALKDVESWFLITHQG